jgi:hypothetical protein
MWVLVCAAAVLVVVDLGPQAVQAGPCPGGAIIIIIIII